MTTARDRAQQRPGEPIVMSDAGAEAVVDRLVEPANCSRRGPGSYMQDMLLYLKGAFMTAIAAQKAKPKWSAKQKCSSSSLVTRAQRTRQQEGHGCQSEVG